MSQNKYATEFFPFIIMGAAIVFAYKFIWHSLENYYPVWAYEAFTIPWLFTLIYSLYLYSKSININIGKILVERTLIPLCILSIPFYIEFMTGTMEPIFRDCSMGCTNEKIIPEMIGFEPYTIYLALFILALSWFTNSEKPQKTID